MLETNVLYYGDNLEILRRYVPDESVDLIYLDPPFNSNRAYNVIFKDESGPHAAAREYNTRLFDRLAQYKVSLEEAFGRPLTWDRAEGRRFCSIADTSEGDVSTTEKHDELVDWIFDSIGRWRKSLAKLSPDVFALQASAPQVRWPKIERMVPTRPSEGWPCV